MNRLSSRWSRLVKKGPRQLAQMLARAFSERVDVGELEYPLFDADVWDSGRSLTLADPRPDHAEAPRLGWIVVPPGIGSGGHTTLFRMMEAARQAGFHNTLLFYDRFSGDFATNVARVRDGWPGLDCEILPVPSTLAGFDLCIASSWPTAHVLASRSSELELPRAYFIQDYEAWFYPRGALYALAQDTYRFGLANLALGEFVAQTIAGEADAQSRVIPFGTDRSAYHLIDQENARAGVVFFAKLRNDRRGYRLAVLALVEFQRLHPTVPIHVYGDKVQRDGLHVENHGFLSPERLNELYNSAVAGLALSFTNVSLIPAEMAAAGVVPVINDDTGARAVFTNPEAIWAPATPTGLADALSRAVSADDVQSRARRLSGWRGPTWEDAGAEFVRALRALLVEK